MEAEKFESDDKPSEVTQWAEEATEDDDEFAELDDEHLTELEDYEDSAPALEDDDVIEP